VIRDFRWGDFPAVRALWEAVGSSVLPEPELRATLAANPRLLLVAEDGGIAGVVLGTFDGRRGWIHRLAVHPGRRRGGVASRLVAELEQRLRSQGAPRINLLVLPDNPGGLAFWQRLGYLRQPDVLCSKPV
jgi:ribosomal protein S18 acetylase RimI-like enzyme